MLFILAWLLGACAPGSHSQQKEQASTVEETTEETAQESAQRTTREHARSAARRENTTPPEPQTPEERIQANLEQGRVVGMAQNIKDIWVFADPGNGCTRVRLDYQARGLSFIEHQMEGIYKAVYGDAQLGRSVCDVEVNAYAVHYDDYGQPYEELVYSTHMEGSQADRVNWNQPEQVNFPKVWTTNYKHPLVEQEEDREELERAIDCAVDEGFFDNWLCP